MLTACHHEVAGSRLSSLEGLTLDLVPSPAVRVVVEVEVDALPAQLSFDPSQPVSFITSGCGASRDVIAEVKVPDAFGPDEAYPLTRVSGLTVGGRRFRTFEAAMAQGASCVVIFGRRELSDVALEVNPATRTVRFRPSQPRRQWLDELAKRGGDAQVLSITRAPRTDWPLVSARVRQGPEWLDATVLLSLSETKTRLYETPVRAAGLRPGLELLEGLPLPRQLPPEFSQLRGLAYDALEFAQGFGVGDGMLELEQGAPPHGVQGVLGADAWSRFVTTWDVKEDLLVLWRPRVFLSGGRAKCERDGVTSAENCFELHASTAQGQLTAIATVWSPLADGAQLSLEVDGGDPACSVGFTFSPGERGVSTQHRFAWPKLRETLPKCASAFTGATGAHPAMLEESPLPQCAGVCAWARETASRRLSCECQPGVRTATGDARKQLLELYRRALQQQVAPPEQEPDDP